MEHLRHAAALLLVALWSATAGAQEPLKVGFLLKTMQEERYERDREAFVRAAAAAGAEVLFDSSDNDPARQAEQLERMLDAGARVIVLQPAATKSAGALVRQANQRGTKVVGYDAMLLNGPLDFMVMQDSWEVGRLQAEALVRWLRQTRGQVRGKVALLRGHPGDSNAGALSAPVVKAIGEHPGLVLAVDASHEQWSPEAARATARQALREHGDQLVAFVANNSGLARGALAALDEAGRAPGEVFVAGADADLANVRAVVEGRQVLEVWKPIVPLAEAAVEVALQLARGERPTADREIQNGYRLVPTRVTQVLPVTRETVDLVLIASGFYSREEVYGDD